MSYSSSNPLGIAVAGNNGNGTSNTQLYHSRAVYFDSSTNSLIIVNMGSHNIVRWKLGENNWTLVAGSLNGYSGSTSSLLQNPHGLSVDPMGNVYVCDSGNYRVQLFIAGKQNGTTIAGVTNTPGQNSTLLGFAFSLTLDNQLNLYVADSYNHRVQKFLRY